MSTQSMQDRSIGFSLSSCPLLFVAISLVAGILADRLLQDWLAMGPVTWWLIAFAATSAAMTLLNFGRSQLSVVALLLAVGAVGGAWHHFRWNCIGQDELVRFAPTVATPVCVEAIAKSSIQFSPAPTPNPLRAIPPKPHSQLLIQVTRLRDGTSWHDTTGTIRLWIDGKLREIIPGDRILVYGQIRKSRPAMNPGQYDYAAAERSKGRLCDLYTGSPECVTVVAHAGSINPRHWLDAISNRCQTQIARYVDSSSAPIAQALLLGNRSQLSDDTFEYFIKTGTIHMLVVSGMHVGLLAGAMWFLLSTFQVSQRWCLIVSVALVILYAAIVGAGPSVVRASVLVLASLLAITVARRASAINLFAATVLAVLGLSPSELFRGGTQLSFLGVAVVVGCSRSGLLHRTPDPLQRMIANYMSCQELTIRWFANRIKGLTISSFVVGLLVAPLVLFHFNIISPSGLLITPILWPFVSLALVAGLGICTVGFVFPPAAWLLGKICGLCLNATENIVAWASQIPGGHTYAPGPSLWWLLVFYGALVLVVFVPRLQTQPRVLMTAAALWVAVGFGVSAWKSNRADELRCTFLAVGHGTCVVLELPGGQTMLYDAGSLGSPENAANAVSGFLWSRGIRQIDAIVISHADVDHYNSVPGLLERFAVGTIYVSPLMFDPWSKDGDRTAPNILKQKIQEAGVPLREVWMNDRLSVADADVIIEVLHPPRFGVPGRDNANSILLSVEYLGTRILLPGDLESQGIESVMAELPLDTDILLAPHHGSRHSDPPGFAAWCTPEWAIMSGGSSIDATRFASTSYRTAGAEILHTAQSGAIEFVIGPDGITKRQFLPQ